MMPVSEFVTWGEPALAVEREHCLDLDLHACKAVALEHGLHHALPAHCGMHFSGVCKDWRLSTACVPWVASAEAPQGLGCCYLSTACVPWVASAEAPKQQQLTPSSTLWLSALHCRTCGIGMRTCFKHLKVMP